MKVALNIVGGFLVFFGVIWFLPQSNARHIVLCALNAGG